jgi:hypothetical protein
MKLMLRKNQRQFTTEDAEVRKNSNTGCGFAEKPRAKNHTPQRAQRTRRKDTKIIV